MSVAKDQLTLSMPAWRLHVTGLDFKRV